MPLLPKYCCWCSQPRRWIFNLKKRSLIVVAHCKYGMGLRDVTNHRGVTFAVKPACGVARDGLVHASDRTRPSRAGPRPRCLPLRLTSLAGVYPLLFDSEVLLLPLLTVPCSNGSVLLLRDVNTGATNRPIRQMDGSASHISKKKKRTSVHRMSTCQ